jgi:hypothetical protein
MTSYLESETVISEVKRMTIAPIALTGLIGLNPAMKNVIAVKGHVIKAIAGLFQPR